MKASREPERLPDDQLARAGTVFTDGPPMTAEQLVTSGLISHIDEHLRSIRKTIGLASSDRER